MPVELHIQQRIFLQVIPVRVIASWSSKNIEYFIDNLQIREMVLVKTVAHWFKLFSDRLFRTAASFSFISLKGFNTFSSDTKVNLNLEFVNLNIFSWHCRTESKQNLKEGGGKFASKSSSSVEILFFFFENLALFCHQNW